MLSKMKRWLEWNDLMGSGWLARPSHRLIEVANGVWWDFSGGKAYNLLEKIVNSYLYFQLAYSIWEFYNVGHTRIICPKVYLLKYAEEVNTNKCSLQHIAKHMARMSTKCRRKTTERNLCYSKWYQPIKSTLWFWSFCWQNYFKLKT
jgi:hypothetical protein